jgi:hypothetical protein
VRIWRVASPSIHRDSQETARTAGFRFAAPLVCALALAAGCRTSLDDDQSLLVDGGVDSARPRDLSSGPADLVCDPKPPPDAGACPCGMNGLCRPATGRLSVQTQSAAGVLRLTVMDDNGCNRVEVGTEAPIGVPRWAADRARLAFLTSSGSGSTLHVIRVDASGQVVCRDAVSLNFGATEVAWASDTDVWLFLPRAGASMAQLVRWQLGVGAVNQIMVDAARFDAIGDGPLLAVQSCGQVCTNLLTRPQVVSGSLTTLVMDPGGVIGPVRLAPSGMRGVYEQGGINLVDLTTGMVQRLGAEGDRSPAFALPGEQAIVYTTDAGDLEYFFVGGEDAGTVATIPPTWQNVFSPDWAARPDSCGPATCF